MIHAPPMSRFFNVAFSPSDVAIDVGTAAVRYAAASRSAHERPAISGGRNAVAGGVIVDPGAAVEVLHPILRQTRRWMGLSRVRALACAPTDATEEERAMLSDCLTQAGAASVFISPDPLAAAIGGGVDVSCNYAKVIIDLGEGVTDCAVIRSGRIVASRAVRKGCANLRRRIVEHSAQKHRASISDSEAELILRSVDVHEERGMEITSSPNRNESVAQSMNAHEVRAALEPDIDAIIGTILGLIRDLPATFSAETIEDGLFLSGGGALLKGMRERIAAATRLDVRVVADPLRAVVRGARAMLPAVAALQLWSM